MLIWTLKKQKSKRKCADGAYGWREKLKSACCFDLLDDFYPSMYAFSLQQRHALQKIRYGFLGNSGQDFIQNAILHVEGVEHHRQRQSDRTELRQLDRMDLLRLIRRW
jgi:hypothetical protein